MPKYSEEFKEKILKRAKSLLNKRPRKSLGCITPIEVRGRAAKALFEKSFGEILHFKTEPNILNVIQNIDLMTSGGSAERTRQLGFHLSNLGYNVTLLTTNYRLCQSTIDSLGDVKLIAIPCLIKRFYVPLPLFWIVNKAVKNADVVQLVNHWTILNAIVYVFLRIHKKPYVINPQGALPIFGRSSLLKRLYNFVVGNAIVRKANLCVVNSHNELPALSSYGFDESLVIHIPNGINEYDYLIKGDSGISEEVGVIDKHPFILFIGRLNHIKGPDLLVEAFCMVKDSFPDIHLVYIGPDEGLLKSLQKTASRFSVLERTHFLGWVSKEHKAAILHASSFLVVPSRQEAMSIVVLESGVVGKPALITDQCGFDEVAHVGGGMVVPATVDGIASGINELLGHESDLSSMGLNLQKLVMNNFLWPSIAKQYVSVFDQLIKR